MRGKDKPWFRCELDIGGISSGSEAEALFRCYISTAAAWKHATDVFSSFGVRSRTRVENGLKGEKTHLLN